jgi:hypothetical protein
MREAPCLMPRCQCSVPGARSHGRCPRRAAPHGVAHLPLRHRDAKRLAAPRTRDHGRQTIPPLLTGPPSASPPTPLTRHSEPRRAHAEKARPHRVPRASNTTPRLSSSTTHVASATLPCAPLSLPSSRQALGSRLGCNTRAHVRMRFDPLCAARVPCRFSAGSLASSLAAVSEYSETVWALPAAHEYLTAQFSAHPAGLARYSAAQLRTSGEAEQARWPVLRSAVRDPRGSLGESEPLRLVTPVE